VRLAILLALLLGLASLAGAEAAGPLAFERGSWAKLRTAHAGQPTVDLSSLDFVTVLLYKPPA